MGLNGGVELRHTPARGVRACQIRIVQRPQHELRWECRTLRTQQRIDDRIERNQNIALGECDLREVARPVQHEVDTKALPHDGDSFGRGWASYTLCLYNGGLYLFAHCPGDDALMVLSVERMRTINVEDLSLYPAHAGNPAAKGEEAVSSHCAPRGSAC
jgi:hypothetical protein